MGRKSKILLIVVGSLAIGLLLFKTFRGFQQIDQAFTQDLPSVQMLSSEDSSLISKEYLSKIQVVEKYKSKVRSPIVHLLLDSQYHLIFYRLPIKNVISLDSSVKIEKGSSDLSTDYTYQTIISNPLNLGINTNPIDSSNKVYITLLGTSITSVAKNDTIAAYSFECDNFSIRLTHNGPVEIFGEARKAMLGSRSVSVNLLLLNRNKYVYMLIATPFSSNKSISNDLLYKVVTGSIAVN